MSNELENEKKQVFSFVIICVTIIFGVVLSIYSILLLVDHEAYGGKYYHSLFTESDCDFKLPEGSKVERTKGGEYAISVGDGTYMWTDTRGRIYDMYLTISKPDLFFDSCTAKGHFKEWVEQNKPKIEFEK